MIGAEGIKTFTDSNLNKLIYLNLEFYNIEDLGMKYFSISNLENLEVLKLNRINYRWRN